ncbi:hypothetical protein AMELA_G00036340 [Ameiurus melas]|uniref:Uncharacterized protein n=1 Tax=Ameiurus melas TaxID=219545 RepID=A0A7J6B8L3_AMEME|nr:hypothetical protein AMELA_G00036340 [Ameiurus melas]
MKQLDLQGFQERTLRNQVGLKIPSWQVEGEGPSGLQETVSVSEDDPEAGQRVAVSWTWGVSHTSLIQNSSKSSNLQTRFCDFRRTGTVSIQGFTTVQH